MRYQLVKRAKDDEPVYSYQIAADIARISTDFLRQLEEEQLVLSRWMSGGLRGFSAADVEELSRIRRLHEDLELDLPAVEIILHMRQQMLEMMRQMDEIESWFHHREESLLNEIHQLRHRLAEEGNW
jgi:DNA-binding transcriptional MerR regulator